MGLHLSVSNEKVQQVHPDCLIAVDVEKRYVSMVLG